MTTTAPAPGLLAARAVVGDREGLAAYAEELAASGRSWAMVIEAALAGKDVSPATNKIDAHWPELSFHWWMGTVDYLTVDTARVSGEELKPVLRHPAMALVRAVLLTGTGQVPSHIQALLRAGLGTSVHDLAVGPSHHAGDDFELGPLGQLWQALPQLRRVVLRGSKARLDIERHDELVSLRTELLQGNLSSLASAHLPNLRDLQVSRGGLEEGWTDLVGRFQLERVVLREMSGGPVQELLTVLGDAASPAALGLGVVRLEHCDLHDDDLPAVAAAANAMAGVLELEGHPFLGGAIGSLGGLHNVRLGT